MKTLTCLFFALASIASAQLTNCPGGGTHIFGLPQPPAEVRFTNGITYLQLPELCRDHTNAITVGTLGTNTLTLPAGWIGAAWIGPHLISAEGPLHTNLAPIRAAPPEIKSTSLRWLSDTGLAVTVSYLLSVTSPPTYWTTVWPDSDGYVELPLTNNYPAMFFRLTITNGF